MKPSNNMQFFIEKRIERQVICDALSSILKKKVSDVESYENDAVIVAIFIEYNEGYALSVNISWPESVQLAELSVEVAANLAKNLKTKVATYFPDEFAFDPGIWCVCDEVGNFYQIKENMELAYEPDGLVLDDKTNERVTEKLALFIQANKYQNV